MCKRKGKISRCNITKLSEINAHVSHDILIVREILPPSYSRFVFQTYEFCRAIPVQRQAHQIGRLTSVKPIMLVPF